MVILRKSKTYNHLLSDCAPINDATLQMCWDFAKNQPDKVYGRRDGQVDKQKVLLDIFVGKLGEFIAFRHLPDSGIPDLALYSRSAKSWDYDLSPNYSVKTQSLAQANRLGLSWVFQKSDKKLKEKDWRAAFVLVGRIDGIAYGKLVEVCEASEVVERLAPLRNNHPNKMAVYYGA